MDLTDLWRGRLSFRRAASLAEHLPPGAALYRELGSTAAWTEEAHLAALVVDNTRILAWQKTKDGSKGRNLPKPTPRPGIEQEENTYGGDAIDMDEMNAWLGGEFADR